MSGTLPAAAARFSRQALHRRVLTLEQTQRIVIPADGEILIDEIEDAVGIGGQVCPSPSSGSLSRVSSYRMKLLVGSSARTFRASSRASSR